MESSSLHELGAKAIEVYKQIRKLESEHLSKFHEYLDSLKTNIKTQMEEQKVEDLYVDGEGSITLVNRSGTKKVDLEGLMSEFGISQADIDRHTTVGKGSSYLKFDIDKDNIKQ